MAYSGIGGQAVMEGVMMKYNDTYAVAVRKPDHEIIIEKRVYQGICKGENLRNFYQRNHQFYRIYGTWNVNSDIFSLLF